jgi:glycosyltransferase involved in cell wall biosynthesis
VVNEAKQQTLAIIVAAFRSRFLAESLASIASQTDQRFHVYVLNDGSKEDLLPVFHDTLAQKTNASYFRFDSNLGHESLAGHWNRCVEQTRGEEWIWLFSDDDVMQPECVSRFYATVASERSDVSVFRFNTLTVDADGNVIAINPPHPSRENAIEFGYHRLASQRLSYASEYIFKREAFNQAGGFVEFPFALGSDDASWIRFTGSRDIHTISGASVLFRDSGANTSSFRSGNAAAKLCALCDFAAWMRAEFAGQSPVPESPRVKIDMAAMSRAWAFSKLRGAAEFISLNEARPVAQYAAQKLDWPMQKILLMLFTPSWKALGQRFARFARHQENDRPLVKRKSLHQ